MTIRTKPLSDAARSTAATLYVSGLMPGDHLVWETDKEMLIVIWFYLDLALAKRSLRRRWAGRPGWWVIEEMEMESHWDDSFTRLMCTTCGGCWFACPCLATCDPSRIRTVEEFDEDETNRMEATK